MKPPDTLSLRQRLVLWVLLPVTLLAMLWGGVTYLVVVHFAYQVHDRALDDMVRSVAAQVRTGSGEVTIDMPRTAQSIIEFDAVDQVFFSVIDHKGRLLAGNRRLPAIPASPGIMAFADGRLDGKPVRFAALVLPDGPGGPGVRVEVAETTRKRARLASHVLTFMVLPLILLVLTVAILLWLGIGRSLAPLSAIGRALASRSHLDLTPLNAERVPMEIRDEIVAINSLMDRLKQALDIRQRFIADAAHQLRTPVTVLKTQAELAVRAQNPAEYRTAAMRLQTGAARLERLVRQLLSLSRAEPGPDRRPDRQIVDMGELTEECVAALVPYALKNRQDIHVDVARPAPRLSGDRFLLGEMISNLVDNAIRYTPPGGSIVVRLTQRDGRALLEVADSGPGISGEERAQVFERFYRSPSAGSEGSGLGLAIVKEIVVSHGGGIRLEDRPEGAGLLARVSLPLEEAARQEQQEADSVGRRHP